MEEFGIARATFSERSVGGIEASVSWGRLIECR